MSSAGPEGKQQNMEALTVMGAEVADGMSYLEENNYVHKELAARNVLVGADNVCKVADFGLGQIIQEKSDMDDSKHLRWNAPEVITSKRFSSKSDVWSFGVLLYEIVTYGGVPYSASKTREISKQVTSGYRLPHPPECPEFLYDVMKECWSEDPPHRPTFKSLRERLMDSRTQQESTD